MWQLRIYGYQDELIATIDAEGTDYYSVKIYQDIDYKFANAINGAARTSCNPQTVVEAPDGFFNRGVPPQIGAKERLESLQGGEENITRLSNYDRGELSEIKRTELVEL